MAPGRVCGGWGSGPLPWGSGPLPSSVMHPRSDPCYFGADGWSGSPCGVRPLRAQFGELSVARVHSLAPAASWVSSDAPLSGFVELSCVDRRTIGWTWPWRCEGLLPSYWFQGRPVGSCVHLVSLYHRCTPFGDPHSESLLPLWETALLLSASVSLSHVSPVYILQ